jgi:hypothetical protein
MEDGYLEELGEDGEGALFVVHALAVGLVECVGLVARQERAGRMLEVGPQPNALILFIYFSLFLYRQERIRKWRRRTKAKERKD